MSAQTHSRVAKHDIERIIMNPLKLRRLLVSIHLYLASFLAPAFMLVAVSGGLYLLGNEGEISKTPIELPAGTTLDFESDDLDSQVRSLLEAQGINVSFESMRARNGSAISFPITRTHVSFQQKPGGLTAELRKPNLQFTMMELHKGHGPRLFRLYQVLVALVLFLVVLGGFAVGVISKAYRKQTLIATATGSAIFILLGFVL